MNKQKSSAFDFSISVIFVMMKIVGDLQRRLIAEINF